jgi:hypothetical protein
MNIFKKINLNILLPVLIASIPYTVNASLIQVSPSAFVGSVSDGAFTMNWNITQNGNTYTYLYTVVAGVSAPANLGLGAFSPVGLTSANFSSLVTMLSGSPNAFGAISGSSGIGGTPGTINGVQFSVGNLIAPNSLEFRTTIAPIWGSDYVVDARINRFTNTNYAKDTPTGTTNFTGWLPVLGTPPMAVPEPGSYLLLGSALLGVAIFKKTRPVFSRTRSPLSQ